MDEETTQQALAVADQIAALIAQLPASISQTPEWKRMNQLGAEYQRLRKP